MITGIVVFICLVISSAFYLVGFFLGARYATRKLTEASISALFDCGIDRATVEKFVKRANVLLKKERDKEA